MAGVNSVWSIPLPIIFNAVYSIQIQISFFFRFSSFNSSSIRFHSISSEFKLTFHHLSDTYCVRHVFGPHHFSWNLKQYNYWHFKIKILHFFKLISCDLYRILNLMVSNNLMYVWSTHDFWVLWALDHLDVQKTIKQKQVVLSWMPPQYKWTKMDKNEQKNYFLV